jgi:hypothetical protein
MLAYDYPLLGMFWTLLWFFLWVAWIILLFRIFGDIFRSKDMGGWSKALWSIFVILLPFLGTFIYVIARGNSMFERDVEEAKSRQEAFDSYIRQTAGSGGGGGGTADELSKLAALKDQGVLTEAEFAAQKAKLLG